MIVTRYLTHEILKTSASVVCILLFIGLSNEFVIFLSKAASGDLPPLLVLKVVAYNVPVLLGPLLPISFFLGILLAYGRLYAESEMTVLVACGLSLWQLMGIAFKSAIPLLILASLLNFWLIPNAIKAQETLIAHAQADLLSQTLVPGRFQESSDGQTIIFVNEMDRADEAVHDVFIAKKPQRSLDSVVDSDRWQVLISEQGRVEHELMGRFNHFRGTGEISAEYLVLEDGARYEGEPGQPDFSWADFREYWVLIEAQEVVVEDRPMTRPTAALWHSEDLEDINEFNWRMALVIAVGVVVVLAIPLSYVSPRKGRYASLMPGLIVVIIYINGLIMASIWLEDGIVPTFLGLWWVHAIATVLGLLLVLRRLQGNTALFRFRVRRK